MPISIWGELFDRIAENNVITLSNVSVRFYQCRRLESTYDSEIISIEPSDNEPDWPQIIKEYNNLIKSGDLSLKNPTVNNVNVQRYLKCNKRVNSIPGKKVIRCDYCSRAMCTSSCETSVHATLVIAHDKSTYELTMFNNLMIKYGDINTIPIQDVEEKILLTPIKSLTYNTKKIISNIDID